MFYGDEFRFKNFRPHPTDPISREQFEGLDDTIQKFNDALGIPDGDTDCYIEFPATEDEPSLIVWRYLSGSARYPGAVLIYKTATNEQHVDVRSDAGTIEVVYQPAAVRTVLELGRIGITLQETSSLDAREFQAHTDYILQRKAESSFQKVLRTPLITRELGA